MSSPKANIFTHGPNDKIGSTRVRSGKLSSGKKYELISQKFDLGGGKSHTSVKAKVTSPGKTVIREKEHGTEWNRRPRKEDTIYKEGTTPGGRKYKARATKQEPFDGGPRKTRVHNVRVDDPSGKSYAKDSQATVGKDRHGNSKYAHGKGEGEPGTGYTLKYNTVRIVKKGPTKKAKNAK